MERADIYVHAKYRALSRLEFDRLAKSFETASFPITLEIFQKGIEVELSLDEVTLIAKLKVIGAVVLGIYVSVSQYKDFRESVIKQFTTLTLSGLGSSRNSRT